MALAAFTRGAHQSCQVLRLGLLCSLNSSIFFDASVAFGLIQYGARIISSEEADVRVERYRSMVVSEDGKQNTKALGHRRDGQVSLVRTAFWRLRPLLIGSAQSETPRTD